MYRVIILVLNCVLFASAADSYSAPVATSFSSRVDGQDKGGDYGRGYSKKYGFQKLVVTTYLMPKLVPAASYSSYVVHPATVKPCGYKPDNENSPSLKHFEIKTEKIIPVNEMEDSKGAKSDKKDSSELEFERMFEKDYKNMIKNTWEDEYKEWFKDDDGFKEDDGMENASVEEKDEDDFDKIRSEIDAYWDKLKKEFDAYYEQQFNKFFNNKQQAYESDKWEGHPVKPQNVLHTKVYKGNYEDQSSEDKTKDKYKFGDFDYGFDMWNNHEPKW